MKENKINGRQLIVLDPTLLFQMGRTIPLPFQIEATDTETQDKTTLNCVEILRLLPQRRLVCRASYGEQSVIVKIFFHPDKAHNDYQNELQGYSRLKKSGLLTPQQLGHGSFSGEDKSHRAYYVLYEQIHTRLSLEELISPSPDAVSKAYIKQLMLLVARMHNAGIQQIDLHLNNFLVDDDRSTIYTIDCGDVSDLSHTETRLLTQLHKNLADILSQLPIIYDQFTDEFVARYQHNFTRDLQLDTSRILEEMHRWRQWRIRKYLKKAARNCSDFRFEKSWSLLKVVRRNFASGPWLSFYKRLDELVETSPRLKDGNTATVALAECDAQKVVIKRYNIKNFRHRLSRFWRPSRAWKTWQNAHRLRVLGIKTPAPVAVIEQRFGWLRSKAFYLSLYEPAADALSQLSQQEKLSDDCIKDFEQLFTAMIFARMSHGDLKANNILMTENGLTLIDLDAMTFHNKEAGFHKAFHRDMQRFMKNWSKNTKVYQQFEKMLSRLPVS